jgi:hypothetical protein
MSKSVTEYIGTMISFLNLDKKEEHSELPVKSNLLIPFAQTSVSDFNMMIIGSRPSSGRTLFINEMLIANTFFRNKSDSYSIQQPSRSLAYFLTEKPDNYFNKLISGVLGINKATLKWNDHFRSSDVLRSEIIALDTQLRLHPLFLEFFLPYVLNEFIAAIESDISTCHPDYIFIDGLEILAQPETREYDLHGTRNIDVWLDACLELNRKHSIPFVITRLLNPQNDRSFDLFQPVFSDFNSSSIDSSCDIVISIVRPELYGIYNESDRFKNEKTLQFLVHRDRTGSLSGIYHCEIDSEIPRIVFPIKNCW